MYFGEGFFKLGLSDAFCMGNFTKCLQAHHMFILSVLPRLSVSPSKAAFISVTRLLISLSYVYFWGEKFGFFSYSFHIFSEIICFCVSH